LGMWIRLNMRNDGCFENRRYDNDTE